MGRRRVLTTIVRCLLFAYVLTTSEQSTQAQVTYAEVEARYQLVKTTIDGYWKEGYPRTGWIPDRWNVINTIYWNYYPAYPDLGIVHFMAGETLYQMEDLIFRICHPRMDNIEYHLGLAAGYTDHTHWLHIASVQSAHELLVDIDLMMEGYLVTTSEGTSWQSLRLQNLEDEFLGWYDQMLLILGQE